LIRTPFFYHDKIDYFAFKNKKSVKLSTESFCLLQKLHGKVTVISLEEKEKVNMHGGVSLSFLFF
jgi:hypothetical protein